VQRHGAGGAFAVEAGALGLALSGGRALPEAVRGKMEAALGADFSAVRVHVGPQAARIGAIAFTVGSDIYFAPGRYQPETIQGQQLLGHELAHVVQQRAGRVRNPLGSGFAVVQDRALEAEADRLGQRAASHRVVAQPKVMPGANSRAPIGHRFPTAARTGTGRIAPRRPGAAWIQRYEIVEWDGETGEFLAQESRDSTPAPNAFLSKASDQARVKAPTGRIQLRVSENGKMAVEHSDLSRRQAKCFFATEGVIDTSNRMLQGKVRLAKTGQTITVKSKTLHQVVPQAADEDSNAPADADERRRWIAAIQFKQNCNDIAEQISGLSGLATSALDLNTVLNLTGTNRKRYKKEFRAAGSENSMAAAELVQTDHRYLKLRQKLDEFNDSLGTLKASLEQQRGSFKDWARWAVSGTVGWLLWKVGIWETSCIGLVAAINELQNQIQVKTHALLSREDEIYDTAEKIRQSPLWDLAKEYVRLTKSMPGLLLTTGINKHAVAAVGDVYQTSHMATSQTLVREEKALYDFASGQTVQTKWGWHFATVVAVSGGDCVTLENYARGDQDQRGANPDPRWYFQMYGSRQGQSFHEETTSFGTYANPITVVHRGRREED
jgi:hypothetical protein